MVFDTQWFEQHQSKLLWVLSHWSTRKLMRWVLRIRPCDIGYTRDIVALMPNAYTVGNVDGTLTTDFRTHAKYAKRLYHALKPLWWAMHAWDWAVADRWVPEWGCGFATLTAYPDADPETSTVDGYVGVGSVDESFSAIRAEAGSFAESTSADVAIEFFSGSGTDLWSVLVRSILLFDTSGLTSSASISAAVLSVKGFAKSDANGIAPDVDIFTSNPASNTSLTGTDFSTIGTTSQTGSAITYASFSTSAYNDFTFNATGRGNISKTGISKFALRNGNYDAANVAPTWSAASTDTAIQCVFAEASGTTTDPKLVVTYTLPATRMWFFGAN